MAPRRPSISYLTDTLPSVVPPIFDQAQGTTANHRKNIVSLRKVQETCAGITEETDKGIKLVGERAFNSLFVDMVNRVLPVKKGVSVADRIVKFVATYVAYTTEQDADEEDGDSMSSRFVSKLLRHLLAGMEAKDKNVRFRVTLMTASLINGLGEIDDELYVMLRQCLLERSRDKESAVRVQAALGLAKLQSADDEEDEDEESIAQVLLDLLRYDPAAEVRRAALYNLPRTQETLPLILARTRDVDPILRRTVYQGSLSAASLPNARFLSIEQREHVVRNGLGDREPAVRKAAAAMLGGWLDQEDVAGDLVKFLSFFDVVSSEVAEEALLSIFVTRPETLEAEFPEEWWNELSPEKAFLARVFAEHCMSTKDETRLEDAMPVVTALAFKTQDEYNRLVTLINDNDDEEEEDAALQEAGFIVGELLRLAINMDYADEIGRRKMFQLSREMISQPNLPEPLIPRCMDVLSKISTGERDLIRLIVDVVTELREGDGDVEMSEASRSAAPTPIKPTRSQPDDPEAIVRAAIIDMRCLLICTSLLERVNTPLQENSVFHGLLPDLIVPAVRNTQEPALRDQGLVCLGLCCLIDEKMATNSFGLFIQQLNVADDELKVKVVQVIFDLLMVHDIGTLVARTVPADRVLELVRHMLAQDAPEVAAVACEGVAKLMLAGMIEDETTLQSLVLLYFSPETADNQPLRQCLTYFLPVYCYSSVANQRRMLDIFSDTFAMLAQLGEEFENAADLLPLSQMGLMMVDWLDPDKAVERETGVDHNLHLALAVELVKALLTETSHDARKSLASFLSKLNLPDSDQADVWKTQAVYQLIASLKEKRPLSDAASRNAITRFEASLVKKYPELEGYDEDAFRAEGEEHEDTSELFGFIDDVDESAATPERTRRSSRATSRARSMSVQSSDSDATPVKRRPKKKPEPIQEESSEEEEVDDEDVEGLLDSE